MDRDFLKRLQNIRIEWFKETGKDIIELISSGYRCKNHPIERRKKHLGPHTKGKAVDIKVSGKDAKKLFKIAKKYMTGIGLAQRNRKKKNRYIHLDALTPREAPRPTIWVY